MDEYIVIMRLDLLTQGAQPSPEQLEGYMKQYHDWVGGIAAQNKFSGGKGLSVEGKVLHADEVITDGPYAETKESVAGFIIIRAGSFEEAVEMAQACPILKGEGNTVEVRKIISVHETE
jgi:hypothetical protein